MRQDSTAVPLETEATKQEIVEKLEAAFEQIAAQLDVPVEKVRNIAKRRHVRLKKSDHQHREQTVRRLRKAGYSSEEIAEALGLSLASVSWTIAKLLAEGKLERRRATDEEMSEREDQIVKLRKAGCSSEEIAEELELSVSTINAIASKLIQEGRVEPQQRGRFLSDEVRQEREDQIVKLRKAGCSSEEIAEELELSTWCIAHVVSKLIAEGKIEPFSRGKEAGSAFWYNLEDERVQTIIRMVKARATLQEMGDALGCTREWVRQVIGRMKDEHGDAIFASEEAIWTPQEAADELGVNANIVSCLCRSGEVPTKRRGVNDDGSYLIYEEGMRVLRAHPLVTRERQCIICKKTFVYEQGSGSRQVCSDSKCLEEYHRKRRTNLFEHEPTLDSLRGWRRELWQRLQSHKPPKKERWLTLSEACEVTGLSKMQVGWLGRRRIVTTGEHPTKRWSDRAVFGYATSEMEIARQVFEAHAGRTN